MIARLAALYLLIGIIYGISWCCYDSGYEARMWPLMVLVVLTWPFWMFIHFFVR